MLSERLQALAAIGVVERTEDARQVEYALTPAGEELIALISALGTWGQRWLPRRADQEDLDLDPVLVDMQRRVSASRLPKAPLVIRFDLEACPTRFMLLKAAEVSLCSQNPGFPEPLSVRGRLAALVGWWRGDMSLIEARRTGLVLEGPRALVRDFPAWFERYQFAGVEPVVSLQPVN
jgi:hypothetical protein